MFARTDTEISPWWVIDANDKRKARLNCIQHILNAIPYDEPTAESIVLPKRQKGQLERPPMSDQTFVKDHYP